MKSISESKLRRIVREEVKKILEEEFLKLRIMLLPHVSDKEQNEIEKMFGKEIKKEEIVSEKEIKI